MLMNPLCDCLSLRDARHVPLRYRARVPGSHPRYRAACESVAARTRRLAWTRSARVVGTVGSYPRNARTGRNRAATGSVFPLSQFATWRSSPSSA